MSITSLFVLFCGFQLLYVNFNFVVLCSYHNYINCITNKSGKGIQSNIISTV